MLSLLVFINTHMAASKEHNTVQAGKNNQNYLQQTANIGTNDCVFNKCVKMTHTPPA